jgi:flagellar protein FlaG
MEITPIERSLQVLPSTAPVTGAENPAERREVIQAVKAVNGAELMGQDNELMFQMDRQAQRMVIRVVNRKTGDVISQLPPEYVLRLAAEARQNQNQSGRY